MSTEAVLGFQFLYGLLSSDSTLASLAPGGGARDEADPGTTPPYWIQSLQSPGVDSLTLTAYRVMSMPLYLIKVCGPSAITVQISNAYAQIEALLGGRDGLKNQSVAGGYIPGIYRESPFMQPGEINGEKWQYIGGLYRMEIYLTS